MPILAGLLLTLMTNLVVWLGQWFAKRAAWTVAIVATSTGAMLAFWLIIQTAITALATSIPDIPGIGLIMYLVVPSNFPVVSANLLTAEIAFATWRWYRYNLTLAA